MVVSIIIASVLAIAFIAVRVTIGAKNVNGGVISMLAKTAASLGFIAVAITALYNGVDNVQASVFVLAGLIFGLVGDMVLDLKVVYMKQPEEGIYLTGGMVSFGIGHIMYLVSICLLCKEYIDIALGGVCVAVAAVLAFGMVFGGERFLGFRFGKYTIHSLLYAFVLLFMSAFSIGTCIVMKSTRMLQFAIGMVLFLLSDAVLTQMYFGGRPRDKTLCVINHVLYYAAQIVLASFLFTM
ncbi:MAG: lysoplasmalogenase family protein [Christensenellales bacterium]